MLVIKFLSTIFPPSLIYFPGPILPEILAPSGSFPLASLWNQYKVFPLQEHHLCCFRLCSMHILRPSSHRPSGCSEMCRHFFLPLKTLWTYPILEPGNNLNLGCSAILWYTLFNLKSNPFILKYNPLGYLYVVIFHWLSHTCTNLRASSSSQGIPRLREN